MSCLDVDNKNGKSGRMELMKLELANEDLPDTMLGATPNDGDHHIFMGAMAQGANKFGSGLDSAGMIPVPGSNAVGKGQYRLVKNGVVAPVPEWLKRLAGEKREKAAKDEPPAVDADLEHNVERAISYLQNAPEAIEGAGGDHTAYTVACKVRDFGVSENMAVELMHEHYADRCSPYDADWIEAKVANAYQYAQKPLGASTAEAAFKDIKVEQAPDDDDWPRPAGSYEGTPPETEWIVDGWIPKGDAVLFTGEGGIGKSLLMMQLEAHVASGRTFLGNIVEQCKVLHVLCEDDDKEIHRRYDRIKRSSEFAFTPDDVARMGAELQFWSRVGKDAVLCAAEGSLVHTKPFFDKLKRAIDRMGYGHKLLVLDTLADVFAGNENDRSQVNQFVKNYIMQLARSHDCTPVIIGHPPKSGAEYSGSTAWNGAVRSRM
jgi:KaiC/GvpD/RAD55 family RecA-like ATPase